MDDQPLIIQPVRPPLSHLDTTSRSSRNWARPLGFALLLFTAVAGLILVFTFEAPTPGMSLTENVGAEAGAPGSAGSTPASGRQERAPFADLEYERQLGAAKERLTTLVETQIALKETMQVGLWGEDDYRAAMDRATEGDLAFQAKRYEEAFEAYGDAAARFAALKAKGEALFAAHLDAGRIALDNRDPEGARRAFESALVIKAAEPAAQAGLQRATVLPQVIEGLRQATNHELAGRWPEALAAYDEVARSDPETKGLAELRAAVGNATTEQQVRRHLSDGFAALDAAQFERARSAFNRVLSLDPGNSVAAGALQQVSNQGDISRIKAGEQKALAAEAREDWAVAQQAYEDVLAIDGAIEFAKTGVRRTQEHERATTLLEKIRQAPEKLSSPALFAQAQEILAVARALEPGGQTLREQVTAVDLLIRRYSEPVDVTLTSDGATDVVLSTVGRLGTFSHKTVSLRPGEYTVVGSQRGCRDVRETIVVKPEMQPVSVRCTEPVN